VVLEKLGALVINVQGVMKLRSGIRSQGGGKDRPLIPQFVSVPRGPPAEKAALPHRALLDNVETYAAPKGR
jgi:hypothetical protein